MIKVIIFDWGNVIYVYHPEQFIERMSRHFGVSKSLFAEVELKHRIDHDAGVISTRQFVARVGEGIGRKISVKEYYGLAQRLEMATPNKELLDDIKRLRKQYKIFLLSNNSKPTHDHFRKSTMHRLFDKSLFSYQVKMKKPDKRFFDLLLRGTSYTYQDCLMVDDREDICNAAEKFGMKAIIYKDNGQLKKEMASFGITESHKRG